MAFKILAQPDFTLLHFIAIQYKKRVTFFGLGRPEAGLNVFFFDFSGKNKGCTNGAAFTAAFFVMFQEQGLIGLTSTCDPNL